MLRSTKTSPIVTPWAGPVEHCPRSPAPTVPLRDDPEVRPGCAVLGEALHPVRLGHEALERRARDPRRGHLEQQPVVADLPALADDGTGDVEPVGVEVLAERAGRQVTAELGRPPRRVLGRVRVDRLVPAAVVPDVDDLVARQTDGAVGRGGHGNPVAVRRLSIAVTSRSPRGSGIRACTTFTEVMRAMPPTLGAAAGRPPASLVTSTVA